VVATLDEKPLKNAAPNASKIPFLGNTLEMAKDPAAFFVRC